jgi:hypothetical protein
MKTFNSIILLCLISCLSFGQRSNTLNWITGTWKVNAGDGFIVEQWKQLNDSTFIGKSHFVKATKDSILQETLTIGLKKGEWHYTSTVVGQNGNRPVSFKLTFIGQQEFISTNPEHDFPQRIAYRRIKDDLFASIEGIRRGKLSKQNFDFSKE